MNINELREELANYDRLTERLMVLQAVLAENRSDWEITSTVKVNGREMNFSLPIGKAAVDSILNNRIALVSTALANSRAALGITP